MNEILQSRRDTDWFSELRSDEKGLKKERGDEIEVVYLRGLQRLAELAGIKRSNVVLSAVPGTKMPIFQAVYTAEFDDGTQWVGAADCNYQNTNETFRAYPTAVAESRAEARCLRKALGIRILSSEEIGLSESFGDLEADPNKPINDSIAKAIEKLCDSRGVDPIQVIEEVVPDQERALKISELKHLTLQEGQAAMSYLNGLPVKEKSTRASRKKELEEKLNESTS
jgi:hypothetical protein